MSRSRRHIQIVGNAMSKSEKDDKQRAAMPERKRMKDRIKPHIAADGDLDVPEYSEHPRSGQWIFAKDGKQFLRRPTPKDMRK